jgi:oxygen-dependent protoporphyrinogen oxidase
MASIVVIGGGVAGLTCAWRLQQAGHDVEVLERESESGGRMRSERHGEFTIERGAQFVASGYHNVHSIAAALGLSKLVQPHAVTRDAVLHDGVLRSVDLASPLRTLTSSGFRPAALLRLARLGIELVRQRHRLDPEHPERALLLDVETLPEGLRRIVGDEVYEALLAPSFSATFDEEPERLSFGFGLLMLRLAARGAALESFTGGNGVFTQALARQVPVLTGCEVHSVETETDGTRVSFRRLGRESRVFADAVVVAAPGSRVADLCPKLTPSERGFFEHVEYSRGIVAHLLLDRAPPGMQYSGIAFSRSEGLDLYGVAVEHHKRGAAPAGAGSINAVLTSAACDRMWHATDEEVAARVCENLARTPVGALTPSGVSIHRWDPMLPRFARGYLRRLAAFRQRLERSPRIAFAGDYLVGPTVEGAVTSGLRAATEVVEAL